jgi:hypothetical protein
VTGKCKHDVERICSKCGTVWTLDDFRLATLAEWYKVFCRYCGGECFLTTGGKL